MTAKFMTSEQIASFLPEEKHPKCYLCGETFEEKSLRPIGQDFQWICWDCKSSSSKIEQICAFNYFSMLQVCANSESGLLIIEDKTIKPWPNDPSLLENLEEDQFPEFKVGVYTVYVTNTGGNLAVFCRINPEITVQLV